MAEAEEEKTAENEKTNNEKVSDEKVADEFEVNADEKVEPVTDKDVVLDLDLELLGGDEVKSGRGGGKRGTGERYTKYTECIKKRGIDTWLKKAISKSKDGIARVRLAQLAEKCGRKLRTSPRGPGLSETALIWGYKYALWADGIKLYQGRTKKEEPVAIFELRNPDDKLPASLGKYYVETPAGQKEETKPEEQIEETKQ